MSTATSDTLLQKQRDYQEVKQTVLSYLKELTQMLEDMGDEPFSGEQRKRFLEKFALLDHRLLDRLDVRSYEYFEEKEREEVNRSVI